MKLKSKFAHLSLLFIVLTAVSASAQSTDAYKNQVVKDQAPAVAPLIPGVGAAAAAGAGVGPFVPDDLKIDNTALAKEKEKQKQKDRKKDQQRVADMLKAFTSLQSAKYTSDEDLKEKPVGSISQGSFNEYPDVYGAAGNTVRRPLIVNENCSARSGLQVPDDLESLEDYERELEGHTCSPNDTDRLTCMVCNLYFESNQETNQGQIAVGQTVMTRLFSTSYSNEKSTVCNTVWKDSQYSWTKPEVMSYSRRKMTGDLKRVIKNAVSALCQGSGQYTNYYAWKIVNPDWAKVEPCAGTQVNLGNHNFCRIGNVNSPRPLSQILAAERIPVDYTRQPSSTGDADREGGD